MRLTLRRARVEKDDAGWYTLHYFLGRCTGQHFHGAWRLAVDDAVRWTHQ